VLLETETDTERRETVLAARFRDTERESAGVGLKGCNLMRRRLPHCLHCPAGGPAGGRLACRQLVVSICGHTTEEEWRKRRFVKLSKRRTNRQASEQQTRKRR
jgi:hypothetical protein